MLRRIVKSDDHCAALQAAGPLLRETLTRLRISQYGEYGPGHWLAVVRNSLELSRKCEVDPLVPVLFSVLHDACRIGNWKDPEHGARAADLARELAWLVPVLDDDGLATLQYACLFHSSERCAEDGIVAVCWDADRLDVGRLPRPSAELRLCTPEAKAMATGDPYSRTDMTMRHNALAEFSRLCEMRIGFGRRSGGLETDTNQAASVDSAGG